MPSATITHYDFCNLLYSSFYLNGFEELTACSNYRLKISRKVPDVLRDLVDEESFRDTLFSIALFEYRSAETTKLFCIDTRDSHHSDPAKGKGYHLPLLNVVDFYFKANFDESSIENEVALRKHRQKIRPVAPFIPLRLPRHRYLPRLRQEPLLAWDGFCITERLKHLKNIVSLDWIRRQRNSPKTCDVRLMVGYYHEPEQIHENQFRFEIMEALNRQPGLNCEVGFASPRPIPKPFDKYHLGRALMRPHLLAMAAARTGIYVRGIHGCHSFKLGQLLALGIPGVGQRVLNNRQMFENLPGIDEQFAFEDPVEIAERAAELAKNRERLDALAESNARYFDEHLSPVAVVTQILQRLSDETA
jgi:hypothetical protein